MSSLTEWDACFEILGMTISGIEFPEEIKIDKDMLLKGIKSKPSACLAHLRVITTKKEEILYETSSYKKAQERLLNFASLFALQFGSAISFDGCGASSLADTEKLGEAKGLIIKASVSYPPEKLEEYRKEEHERVRNFVKYFKNTEARLKEPYLENALHYFYYGIRSDRLEEKIIDFFISLESLVGAEKELTYRMATRIGILLDGKIQGKESLKISKDIQSLYGKRSGIVHGGKTKISYSGIETLQTYLRELIKIFLKLPDRMSRKDFLNLVDDSILDDESREKLTKLIS